MLGLLLHRMSRLMTQCTSHRRKDIRANYGKDAKIMFMIAKREIMGFMAGEVARIQAERAKYRR